MAKRVPGSERAREAVVHAVELKHILGYIYAEHLNGHCGSSSLKQALSLQVERESRPSRLVAPRVRRAEGRSSPAPEGPGAGECPPRTGCCGSHPGKLILKEAVEGNW